MKITEEEKWELLRLVVTGASEIVRKQAEALGLDPETGLERPKTEVEEA